MNFKKLTVVLKFGKPGYCDDPYWPEISKLIDIQKISGSSRARSDSKKRMALEQYLKSQKISLTDYEKLENFVNSKEVNRHFHTNTKGEIVIPSRKILACLVNACDLATSSIRPCRVEYLRRLIKCNDFNTKKKEIDGWDDRMVPVKNAVGKVLSNQRGFRSHAYIENFEAHGFIEFESEHVNEKTLRNFLHFAGWSTGVGSMRKMAYGTFTITIQD